MSTENKDNTQEEKKTPEVRKHKRLGVYKKVIVNWKEPNKQKLDVYVSINSDTFVFKPDTPVELPTEIVKFLKNATYEEHYFDKEDKKHKSKSVRKYTIESAEE